MRTASALIAWVALAGLAALAAADAPVTALRGLDPVELTAGREVPGKAAISTVRGPYRYLFASEENRRLFLSSGEQYAIQYGGACARMGPFSGRGDPDRFLVHDGWIFIFASEACRERFESTPQKFLERADRPPVGTPEEAKRAAELMEQAIAGVGGAQRLGELAEVTERRRITVDAGGKPYSYEQTVRLGFPESIRVLDQHGPSTYGWALEPEGGARIDADEAAPAERSVTEIMRREYYRHPLALLKAWQRGAAIGYARGRGTSGKNDVERVAVHVAGATTTLGIEPASGRIVEAAYRGWLDDGIGEIEQRYSDFREVHGIVVPFQVERWANGKPEAGRKLVIESIEVLAKDHDLDAVLLGHALDTTAVTGLALALLEVGDTDRATEVLQAALAAAVREADQLTADGTRLATTAPNLLAGLGRAAEYAAEWNPAVAEAALRTRERLEESAAPAAPPEAPAPDAPEARPH